MDKQWQVNWPTGFNLLLHDLNNDLSLILGRCEMLYGHLSQNEEALQHLKVIQDRVRRIADSIRREAA
jgi:hypothetical protein